jgi:hypothetical protein
MNRGDAMTMELMGGVMIPETRMKDGADGVAVVLSDGNTWLLADGGLANVLDGPRDSIDDDARLNGQVQVSEVRRVAFILLKANYELSDSEAAGLILEVDHQVLTDAVSTALFGPSGGHQTYTAWATSAMLANGLDPEKIPWRFRAHVLSHLVATGRAIPADQFIDSAIAGPKLRAARARVAAQQVEAQAAIEADPTAPTPDDGPSPSGGP